jgi:hypothetical protein
MLHVRLGKMLPFTNVVAGTFSVHREPGCMFKLLVAQFSSAQDQCGDLPFAVPLVPPSTSDSISDSSVLKYTPLNLPSNLTSVLASTFIRSQCSSSAADCKLPISKQTRLALSPGSHTWNTASLIGGIGCACASGVVLAAIFGPTRLRPIENFQNLNRNNPSCRCLVRSLYYFPLVGVKK